MKKIIFMLFFLLLTLSVLFFAKNIIIGKTLRGGVTALTGLKIHIDKTESGIFATYISLEGIKLQNPPDFAEHLMADMPELYMHYNLPDIFKGKIHLHEARIHLREFVVIRNKDGKLNLDSLKVVDETKKEAKQAAPAKKEANFMIDVMQLKIDKVVFKDYTAGDKPKVTEYPVRINERFTNIDDPKKVANTIIARALMNTAIARLTSFDVNSLASSASDTLRSATKIAADTAQAAIDGGKKAVGTAEKAAGDTVDKTKEAIDKILPFGGSSEKKE